MLPQVPFCCARGSSLKCVINFDCNALSLLAVSWQPAFPRHDAEPCSSPAASSRDEDTLWSLGCVRNCISSSLALMELCCEHSTDLPVLQEPTALPGNTGAHATQTVKWHPCSLLDRAYLIKVWQTVEPQSTQICCNTQILCWNQLVLHRIIRFICNLKRDCRLLTTE